MSSNDEYTPTFKRIEADGDRLTAVDEDNWRTHIEKNDWADWHEGSATGEWEPVVGAIMSEIAHDGGAIPNDPSDESAPEIKIDADGLPEMIRSGGLDEHFDENEETATRQAQALLDFLISEQIFDTDGSDVYVLKNWNNEDLTQNDYLNWAATFEQYIDMIETFEGTIKSRISDLEEYRSTFIDNGLDQAPAAEIADRRDSLIELFDGNQPPKPETVKVDATGDGFYTVEPPEQVPESKIEEYQMHYGRMIEIKNMEGPVEIGPNNIQSLEDQLRMRLNRLQDLQHQFNQAINQFRWASVNADSTEEERKVKDCMQSFQQLFLAVSDMAENVTNDLGEMHEEFFPDTEQEPNTDDLDAVNDAEEEVKQAVNGVEDFVDAEVQFDDSSV